ncbi:hypothetical protein CSPX01_09945 [Colletotrichum filicis]|nr:hypothetical protein CSPX01_09945 [Colletotrichum filicis]
MLVPDQRFSSISFWQLVGKGRLDCFAHCWTFWVLSQTYSVSSPQLFLSHFSYTSIQSTAFKRKGKEREKELNPAWTSTALLIISRLTPRHPDRSTPPPPHSPHAVGWSSSELLGTPAHRHTPAQLLLLPKIILFLARRLVFATHFLPVHLPTTFEQQHTIPPRLRITSLSQYSSQGQSVRHSLSNLFSIGSWQWPLQRYARNRDSNPCPALLSSLPTRISTQSC